MTTPHRFSPVRLWRAYVHQLHNRPITTKTCTSFTMYAIGDITAQTVFEGRRIDWEYMGQSVGLGLSAGDKGKGKAVEFGTNPKEVFDLARFLRISSYGFVFAPLAHTWFSIASSIRLASRMKTTIAKLSLDATLWSPFVCALFPTYQGLVEGKTIEQIKQKVDMVWLPTWKRAIFVFSPVQLINFTFVPFTYQVLLLQSVGFCWNIYLSWLNNRANEIAQEMLPLPMD